MATIEEVASVRRRTAEPTDEFYTDDAMEVLIDTYGVEGAIGEVWEEKAARFSALVDIAEGSSRRSMSQQHAHALKMVNLYRADAAGPARAKVHRLTRL